MRDTTTTQDPGPALAAHIDGLRGATSARQFALEHGLDDARISAWRMGATPRIEHLRQVADGLGMTLGEVLVVAGLATREECEVRPDVEMPPPSFDDATAPAPDGDPALTELEKVALRSALENLRAVVNDRRRSVRARVVAPRGSGRSRG